MLMHSDPPTRRAARRRRCEHGTCARVVTLSSGVVLRSHYQSLSRGAGARGVVHLTLSGFSLFPFFLSLS